MNLYVSWNEIESHAALWNHKLHRETEANPSLQVPRKQVPWPEQSLIPLASEFPTFPATHWFTIQSFSIREHSCPPSEASVKRGGGSFWPPYILHPTSIYIDLHLPQLFTIKPIRSFFLLISSRKCDFIWICSNHFIIAIDAFVFQVGCQHRCCRGWSRCRWWGHRRPRQRCHDLCRWCGSLPPRCSTKLIRRGHQLCGLSANCLASRCLAGRLAGSEVRCLCQLRLLLCGEERQLTLTLRGRQVNHWPLTLRLREGIKVLEKLKVPELAYESCHFSLQVKSCVHPKTSKLQNNPVASLVASTALLLGPCRGCGFRAVEGTAGAEGGGRLPELSLDH